MSSRPYISLRITGELVVKMSSAKRSPPKIKNETTPEGIAPFGSTHSPFAVRFQYLCAFHQIGES